MPEADVVLGQHWTNVIQSLRLRTAPNADPDIRMRPRWAVLHLGGGDGSNSDGDIKWYDKQGNNVIHMSATETENFDSYISAVGEDGFLRLGGEGVGGYFQIQDVLENTVITMDSRGPYLRLYDDDGSVGLTLYSGAVETADGRFTDVSVGNTITANHGVIKDLDLGGGNPNEDVYEPGRLNVWSDQGKEGVVVDGQSGSIEHTGPITRVSDASAKRNVQPVEEALDTVRELEGVEYEWDTESVDLNLSDDRHVGFLAEDVEEVLPEAVAEHKTGYKGTADAAFTPVLVEAIKEQQSLIDEQRETIDKQEAQLEAQAARIEDQRDRISKIESRLGDIESAVRDTEE